MILWFFRTVLALVLLAMTAAHASGAPGKLDARARAALGRLKAGGQSVEAMRANGAAIDRHGNLDVFIRGSASRTQLEEAGARVRTAERRASPNSMPAWPPPGRRGCADRGPTSRGSTARVC